MKKLLLFIPAILLLINSCNSTQKKHDGNLIIKGKVKGLRLGTLLIKKVVKDSLVSLDSIKVDGFENFEFYTNIDEPQIMVLELPEIKEGFISFFATPNDTIDIFTYLESFALTPIVKGGKNQQLRNEYNKMIKQFNNTKLDLIQAKFDANKIGNKYIVDSLTTKLERLQKRRILYNLNFIMNNKNNAIAPYTAMMEFYDNSKALDTIYKILPKNLQESIYGKEIRKILDNK